VHGGKEGVPVHWLLEASARNVKMILEATATVLMSCCGGSIAGARGKGGLAGALAPGSGAKALHPQTYHFHITVLMSCCGGSIS